MYANSLWIALPTAVVTLDLAGLAIIALPLTFGLVHIAITAIRVLPLIRTLFCDLE
jgi:hypothetical protein